ICAAGGSPGQPGDRPCGGRSAQTGRLRAPRRIPGERRDPRGGRPAAGCGAWRPEPGGAAGGRGEDLRLSQIRAGAERAQPPKAQGATYAPVTSTLDGSGGGSGAAGTQLVNINTAGQ